MARHSKNNCSGAVFTYAERQKLQYGTQKQRLGKDSLGQWDACGLCLQGLVEPLLCPKGHMFCKECIYQTLLAQKQENKKRVKEWEDNEQRKKEEERAKAAAAQAAEVARFERVDGGILPERALVVVEATPRPAGAGAVVVAAASAAALASDGKAVSLEAEYTLLEDKRAQANMLSATMRKAEMERGLKSNFWMPSNTPTAPDAPLPRPSDDTTCPGAHPLRLKQLVRVNLTPAAQPAAAAAGGGAAGDNVAVYAAGRYECPVCKRTLSNALKPAVLSECGHSACSACLEKYVLKEGRCFVCTKPCREKEVIRVADSATGFAAHGEKLEATKTTPTAWL